MKTRIIPIFIPHVGCPNDCVFCNQKRIAGSICAPKPDEVSALIASGLDKNGEGSVQVAFYGGSFTAIDIDLQNEYLNAACGFENRISGIRVSTRPDAIDIDTVLRLKAKRVSVIEIGAQSMYDEVLSASGRGHTVGDTVSSAKCIKDCGVSLVLQMMVGLPGDTYERAIYTAHEIARQKPDAVRIYPTVVIRDTKLERMWRAGEYQPLTVASAVPICAEIQKIFEDAEIPIIRLGLNPTEDLSHGDALAGVYHPAFGQLVEAHRYLARAREKLKGIAPGSAIEIYVHPSRISDMCGHKKENRIRLKEEFSLSKINILPVSHQDRSYLEIKTIENKE